MGTTKQYKGGYGAAAAPGPGGGVTSVNGDTGPAVSLDNSEIPNVSLIPGATTKDALENLQAGTPAWENVADTQYTELSPFSVTGGTVVKLPNNGGDRFNAYMPPGIKFWDEVSQKITPQGIGETYSIRVNFKAKSSTQSNSFDILLDIGGTQGVILERVSTFPKGANIETPFSSSNAVFAGTTFVSNGGEIYINPVDDIDIYDISFFIPRLSANDLNLPDAPSDGNDYARNNGVWNQINIPVSPTFTTVTPAADFGAPPVAYETVSYSKNGNVLYISGMLARTGTGLTLADTLLFTLPAGFRPAKENQFEISFGAASPATDNGDCICRVKANGQVTATGPNFMNTNDIIRVHGVVKLA